MAWAYEVAYRACAACLGLLPRSPLSWWHQSRNLDVTEVAFVTSLSNPEVICPLSSGSILIMVTSSRNLDVMSSHCDAHDERIVPRFSPTN